MKEPRNSTSNRGYRLTPKAVRILAEQANPNRPAPFQFTHKGAAILQDHKRGFVNADVNFIQAPQIAENPYACPPLTKGEQLEMLMDCADRLHKRWQAYYDAIYALPEHDLKGRNKAFDRLDRVHKACSRVAKQIGLLFVDFED